MNDIKVSVIVPVYNAMPYLKHALDTIVGQSLKDMEIICVDDSSTDDSYDILQEYAKKDNRIRVLRQESGNIGAAEARNKGIDAATGEYLSFLDADDFFEPDMLEKAYRKAAANHLDIIVFDGWNYDDVTGVDYYVNDMNVKHGLSENDVFMPLQTEDDIFAITHSGVWNKLYLRRFIHENGVRFVHCRHADDIVFSYGAFCCAKRVAVMYERLIHYRQHINSQTSHIGQFPEAGYKAYYSLKIFLEKKRLFDQVKIPFVNHALEFSKSVLGKVSSEEKFVDLFSKLKDVYLEEFGAFSIGDNDFYNQSTLSFRNNVKKFSPVGYLLFQLKAKASNSLYNMAALTPVINSSHNCRVAIYGAGAYGVRFFYDLLTWNRPISKIEVCLWVDKNFHTFGYPVKSPQELTKVDFDYVLIAIRKASIVSEVKDYLLDIGIDNNKLINVFSSN